MVHKIGMKRKCKYNITLKGLWYIYTAWGVADGGQLPDMGRSYKYIEQAVADRRQNKVLHRKKLAYHEMSQWALGLDVYLQTLYNGALSAQERFHRARFLTLCVCV